MFQKIPKYQETNTLINVISVVEIMEIKIVQIQILISMKILIIQVTNRQAFQIVALSQEVKSLINVILVGIIPQI